MTIGKLPPVLLGVSAVLALGLALAPRRIGAQDPKPAERKGAAQAGSETAEPAKKSAPVEDPEAKLRREIEAQNPPPESVKPLPPSGIPDDPPPHEGAMINYPITVQPHDIIRIEVLETLPGRPITGDRLVRMDGTVTLGFYGDLDVSGLTLEQVKVKVISHLRAYLTDECLGLVGLHQEAPDTGRPEPEIKGNPYAPKQLDDIPRVPGEDDRPFKVSPREPIPPAPKAATPPPTTPKASRDTSRGPTNSARVRLTALQQPKGREPVQEPEIKVREPLPNIPRAFDRSARPDVQEGRFTIAPAKSDRVVVDIGTYNNTWYFVLGEVHTPGRIPFTGRETVLDALQFAGGIVSDGDPGSVQLVRPARGKKPARVYPIDLAAIQSRGESSANLQLFPGDRLIVSKRPAAEATARITALAQPSQAALNHMTSYAFAMRALANITEPYSANPPMSARLQVGNYPVTVNLGPAAMPAEPAKRKAALRAWAETLSTDEATRGEILKLLDKSP